MSEKYKTYPCNCYFLTMTVEGWIDLFTRRAYAEFMEDNLNHCIDHKGLEVFSYCGRSGGGLAIIRSRSIARNFTNRKKNTFTITQ